MEEAPARSIARLTEAPDQAGSLFSEPRLADFLERTGGAVPPTLARDPMEAVRRYADGTGQSDDIAALALRFAGATAGGSAHL